MKQSLFKIKPLLAQLLLIWLASFITITLYAQQTKFGNSYINLSKQKTGGTVQPGDTLEIRTSSWFTNFNGGSVYFVRYVDNIPSNTIFIDTSLRLVTNEGVLFKQWTLAADTDPATYNASPASGQYNVKINIGRTATAPNNTSNNAVGAGKLVIGGTKDRPLAGGNTLVTTSFRVRVTGNIGDTIILGTGKMLYKTTNSSGAADVGSLNAIQYKILISNNDPICANALGKNFVAEYGGTFDSGMQQNRVAPAQFPIATYNAVNLSPTQAIGDGTYGIVNNLSPWASVYANANKKPNCVAPTGGSPPVAASCTNRMFGGHWDIMGDHTGSSTSAGNSPTTSGSRGGYMLVVNADYVTTQAYAQTITGLCPNTSYEFSLWIKNVCTNCGVDSAGVPTYKPGVYPNLSFAIDGLDRYSSGQVDTLGWQKKGFLFSTGMTQSSIAISIRNNASGGGGNDWAIDDIALVSCSPNLVLVPTGNSQVCYLNQLDINTTVTSFFKNYNYYRWEKSIDGGVTWTVPATGIGNPDPVTGAYVAPMVPASKLADSSDNLNQYRFTVASTADNLNDPHCSFQDSAKIVILVNNCSTTLALSDIQLKGRLSDRRALLSWLNEPEPGNTLYEIEKSENGRQFYLIGQVPGTASTSASLFSFTDPAILKKIAYYRIKVKKPATAYYTRIIILTYEDGPGLRALVNPFKDKVSFFIDAIENSQVTVTLTDTYGILIRKLALTVKNGSTLFTIPNLNTLSKGTYILRVSINDYIINRMIVK